MSKKAKTGQEAPPAPRRPRRPGVKRPPMKKAFIGNFLDRAQRPRGKLRTNGDVSRFLRQAALADLGGAPITAPSPEGDERIARMLAVEVVAAVNRSGGKSSLHWYTEAISRAVRVLGVMHPEILSDEAAREARPGSFANAEDARTVLFCALAITSQNNPVPSNVRFALEQYRHFLATGAFKPKVYGTKGSSIRNNLDRFNRLLGIMGDVATLRRFLSSEFRMGDLMLAGEQAGLKVAPREMVDETVYGSMLFGPKIGNAFYQNLVGNFSPITVDLWFMRTWGRLTGTILKDEVSPAQVERLADGLRKGGEGLAMALAEAGWEADPDALGDLANDELAELARALATIWEKTRRVVAKDGKSNEEISAIKSAMVWPGAAEAVVKAVGAPVDAPERRTQRRWIRQVVARSLEILARNGYEMSAAELQATLWYPERALYRFLTGRGIKENNVSYDEALIEIARKEGHSDDDIARALRAVDQAGRGGPSLPGDAGPGEPAAVRGLRPQPDADRGRAPGPEGRSDGLNAPEEPEEAPMPFALSA